MNELHAFSATEYGRQGVTLFNKKLFHSALACARQAYLLEPESHETTYLLGNVLLQTKRFKDAEIYLRKSLAINPRYAPAAQMLAITLGSMRQFTEVDRLYQSAIDNAEHSGVSKNDIMLDYSLCKLAQGRWREGFAEFETRKGRFPAAYIDTIPQWNGEDISDKTLYVYAEQGVGDTIQFSRYLPYLRACCKRLILGTWEELVCLFRAYPQTVIDEIVMRRIGSTPPDADVCLPLVSAARFLPTNPQSVIAPPNYWRKLASAAPFALPSRPGVKRKIGICWSGNPTHDHDRERSVPLERFLGLITPDVQLYSLQVGQRASEIDMIGAQSLIFQLGPYLTDWVETASAMLALDLVISVDTAVAHLAGTLGVPTWLAITYTQDWRWLSEGDTTAWYPSMRLFRQKTAGDWEDVFDRMSERLLVEAVERLTVD